MNIIALVVHMLQSKISLIFFFSPKSMGLLDPSTSDGRVIFFLPWEGAVTIVTVTYGLCNLPCFHTGATVAGTTDAPTEITADPHPREADIQFILQEIRDYLSPEISGD